MFSSFSYKILTRGSQGKIHENSFNLFNIRNSIHIIKCYTLKKPN